MASSVMATSLPLETLALVSRAIVGLIEILGSPARQDADTRQINIQSNNNLNRLHIRLTQA
jgi:hypothetical protein